MVNNKQRREAARRHLQRQLERRQEAERRRKKATQLIAGIVGIAVVAAAIIVTLVVTGGGDDDETPAAGEVTCTYTPSGTASKEAALPSGTDVAATGTATALIQTNNGAITATLDRANAPCAVNSFVSLASQGYFNATPCHRLTTGSLAVLQCGDPTGTGTGGPGYSFADELTGSESYTSGVIAMANSGPNTNGSQFFLVYGDSTSLPSNYVILGSMDAAGLAVVQSIAAAGVVGGGTDGDPALATTIEAVTVEGGAAPAPSNTNAETVTTPAATTSAG